MSTVEAILLNLREVRRRSLKVWEGIPAEHLHWRPDPEAMSCIEHVRHLLEADYLWHHMVETRASVSDDGTPWTGRPLGSVAQEVAFAEEHRARFLAAVAAFSDEDLVTIRIDRSDQGYVRPLGDFLLRAAYHEAVHTGQLLAYLRSMGAGRPRVWD